MSKNATELGHATDGELVKREFDLSIRGISGHLCLEPEHLSNEEWETFKKNKAYEAVLIGLDEWAGIVVQLVVVGEQQEEE
jgi:hypothetical protein